MAACLATRVLAKIDLRVRHTCVFIHRFYSFVTRSYLSILLYAATFSTDLL